MIRKTPGYVDSGSVHGNFILCMTSTESKYFSVMSCCVKIVGDPHCDHIGLMEKTW